MKIAALVVTMTLALLSFDAQAQTKNEPQMSPIQLAQAKDCPRCATLNQQACVECSMKFGYSAAEANGWCGRRAHCRK